MHYINSDLLCSLSASSPSRDARSIILDMRKQADHFLRVFVPSHDDAGAGRCHIVLSCKSRDLSDTRAGHHTHEKDLLH